MTDIDEDSDVYNAIYEVQVVIDRSVAEVWKRFLDFSLWVTSHNIENAHGSPGTLGSITRVLFKGAREAGMPPAHHHFCKIVKLVPLRQYVLKTYSEKGGSYGWHIAAFDDIRFAEVDGKTRVTFNLFSQMKSDAVVKDRSSIDRAMDVSREGMVGNLQNLKRIVEDG